MADLISVSKALGIIAHKSKVLDEISLPLRQAYGHVLARDLKSKTTLPPLPASAMDGYAIKLEPHHAVGSQFKMIGTSPAGNPFEGQVKSGEAVRIFTGGSVPDGANHVIIQECVSAAGENITLTEPPSTAAHIRKAGIDLVEGSPLLAKGTILDAFACALLAASNHGEIPVFRKPRIALLANGDELVEPGSMIKRGNIVSSNPYGLGPLVEKWGGVGVSMGIAKDSPAQIKAHIRACGDADVLLPIGGASVGDHDYMRAVFDELEYRPLFTKVAVKPGKPTWFGKLEDNYVLGLPGNPASAIVCAHIFLKPLIYALTGRVDAAHQTIPAKLTTDMPTNGSRVEYQRARVDTDAEGQLHVTPFPRQDSSLITPFVKANCLLIRAAETRACTSGDVVHILPMKALN